MGLSTQASAANVYQCSGTVGNGYDTWKPEYKVYAQRNVTFAIQCNLWQQFVDGMDTCTANLDGQPQTGYYLGSGGSKVFSFKSRLDDPLEGGQFSVSTSTIFFKVGDGYAGTNINETQRWFNGKCR